jgi:hypothetical protein
VCALWGLTMPYGVLSSYVTRDDGRSTGTSASSLKRYLNVRTATLEVGHLARGLYATVTTRIHLDWTTSFLSDDPILAQSLPPVSTELLEAKAEAPQIVARTAQWAPGFVVLGVLIGAIGPLLVYWRYHLESDPLLIGFHFLGLNVGYLGASTIRHGPFGKAKNKSLLTVSIVLSFLSLVALTLVGPPLFSLWRIVTLVAMGLSAGLLSAALLRDLQPQFSNAPLPTLRRAVAGFGAGCSVAALLLGAGYQFGWEPWGVLLLLVPLVWFATLAFRGERLAVTPEVNDSQGSVPQVEAPALSKTPAGFLFRLLLLIQLGNEWALAGWLPLFLVGRAGINPAGSLFLLAFYFAVLTLSRWTTPMIYGRTPQGRALVITIIVALLGLTILGGAASLTVALVGATLTAIGFGPVFPLVWHNLDERFSFHHGYYRGTLFICFTGAMSAPWLLGFVDNFAGLAYVLWLPALGAVVSLVLALLLLLETHLMTGKPIFKFRRGNGA